MINKESSIEYEVEYQDVDYQGCYKYGELVSSFANIATRNASEIGLWNDELKDKYGWVLVKQSIELIRPIKLGEQLKIVTRAKGDRRIQFYRTYDLYVDNELIGGAFSIWTLIDIENRRIVRPNKVGIEAIECEEYDSYLANIKDIKEIDINKVTSRKVVYSDLDVNKHMNNARYLEWVMDLINEQSDNFVQVKEMTMHYRKELAYNSLVDLYYGSNDKDFKVSFKIEDEVCFEVTGKLF